MRLVTCTLTALLGLYSAIAAVPPGGLYDDGDDLATAMLITTLESAVRQRNQRVIDDLITDDVVQVSTAGVLEGRAAVLWQDCDAWEEFTLTGGSIDASFTRFSDLLIGRTGTWEVATSTHYIIGYWSMILVRQEGRWKIKQIDIVR